MIILLKKICSSLFAAANKGVWQVCHSQFFPFQNLDNWTSRIMSISNIVDDDDFVGDEFEGKDHWVSLRNE